MKTHCPHARAAIEVRERHLQDADGKDVWAIGDGLVRDLGQPLEAPRGADAKLSAFAKELVKDGYKKYVTTTLRYWWNTAAAFPKSRRREEIPFETHKEAGSPDFLDWVVEQKGTDVSKREVRAMRGRYRVLLRQERRKQIAEAKEAVKRAQTPQAKAKAEEKVEELGTVMPEPSPHKITRPSGTISAALNTMADVMDIDFQAGQLLKELRKQQATISEMRSRIDVEYIDALVEKYEDVSKVATQIADSLGKSRLKRYATITGGKA